MKKILSVLGLVILTASTFAQGTIFFNNRTSAGDVPISLSSGAGVGSIPGGASAQLFLVPSGGGALVPLLPATTFRTSSPAAMYFVNPLDVTVPGIPAGSPATILLRMWDTLSGSYEAATLRGESAQFTIPALGGITVTGVIVPTPDLAGLQWIPEPSTIALGLLGAAVMLFRSRK